MKTAWPFGALALALLGLPALGAPLPPTVQRVLFLGDSITYGGTYIEDAAVALRRAGPNRTIELLNLGLAAETVAGISEPGFALGEFLRPDLHERLARVLAASHPQYVVICYGMNDGLYAPFSPDRFARFQQGMASVHEAAAAAGAAVLHLTPPIFDPLPVADHTLPAGSAGFGYNTPYDGYDRDVLARYSAWLLSQRGQGWEVLDLHAAMAEELARRRTQTPSFAFSGDGVHPNALGHAVMARVLLQYWGAPAAAQAVPEILATDPAWHNVAAAAAKSDDLRRDAWLTLTRNVRPHMPVGLPIDEAERRAGLLDREIDQATSGANSPGTAVWENAARRVSFYLPVRDGTRLALDVYRPAQWSGQPLPVILRATPYHRTINAGAAGPNLYRTLLEHGYVVASLDLRGRGASFGSVRGGGFAGEPERQDLYDVVEWLGTQPWCSGAIGMAGGSYEGLTQFWAASMLPPHLRAIAPTAAPLDWFSSYRENGIFQRGSSAAWDETVKEDDLGHLGAGVDDDANGQQLQAAVAEHRHGWESGAAAATPVRSLPYRDSPAAAGQVGYGASNWWNATASWKIRPIPVLQVAGWDDKFLDQSFALYRQLAEFKVPQRLVIGPWYHTAWYRNRLYPVIEEHVKWFDHWLRDLPGDAPSGVSYYLDRGQGTGEWHDEPAWPPAGVGSQSLYLAAGKLGAKPPAAGSDVCAAAPQFSTASILTRWNYADRGPKAPEFGLQPVGMDALDQQGTTYTSAPLPAPIALVGAPVVTLWIKGPPTTDIFAFLEDVDPAGHSVRLTDGAARAAYRAEDPAPFPNAGLPWHGGFAPRPATAPNPAEPWRVSWALFPLARVVQPGHRLRILLSGFDGAGWDSAAPSTSADIRIYHELPHASTITLPVRP